jgi:hypothetical protein
LCLQHIPVQPFILNWLNRAGHVAREFGHQSGVVPTTARYKNARHRLREIRLAARDGNGDCSRQRGGGISIGKPLYHFKKIAKRVAIQ